MYSLQEETTLTEVPDKWNNQPHIVVFCDEEYDKDLLGQYFIAVEQVLVLESSNIVASLFHCPLYNVQYHTTAKELFMFLQQKRSCTNYQTAKGNEGRLCWHNLLAFSGIWLTAVRCCLLKCRTEPVLLSRRNWTTHHWAYFKCLKTRGDGGKAEYSQPILGIFMELC